MSDTINFDGDQVQFSVRGKTVEVYACDEIDKVLKAIEQADANEPLGTYNDENLLPQKDSHGRGENFIKLLMNYFETEHELKVSGGVAWAMWLAIKNKAEEYRGFFESGLNSQPPSDSRPKESSADAKLNALLSSTPDKSKPPSDSVVSTTA